MILLVDPATKANTNLPNIGLAYLSATLTEMGLEHRVIDQDLMPKPVDRFMKYKTDILGISIKASTYPEAKRVIKLYKDKFPDTQIILGGPHVTCAQERVKSELPEAKLYIGESEYLGTRRVKLDELPFPDYDKFDSIDYIRDGLSTGQLAYPIITSRGCPFGCIYCAVPIVSGRRWRSRSVESCIMELEHAREKYGIKRFEILDDNFTLDVNRALEFCDSVRPLGLKWLCPNGIRADRFTRELGSAMVDSGCFHVSFGIESAEPSVFKGINKGETLDDIERSIKIAKEVGLHVTGFFIIGLPGSTFEKDMYSLNWAKEHDLDADFGLLVPYKGTEVYSLYKDRIRDEDMEGLLHFGYGINAVFDTPEYTREDRIKFYNLTIHSKHYGQVKQ